jgi:hypothetical protein
MTGKTVGLAWYYEATVSGTDEQAATFVSFPWPAPDSGSRNDAQATAEQFGTEFRHALHPDASPEEVVGFVAEALFDTAPLTAMIDQFDERLERGPAPHAAVAQELIDGATTELSVGQTNARRFAEQLLHEPRIPVEQSLVAGASLSQLLALVPDHAGAVIGAWAGSSDNPPLLLITMATGIVILAAAPSLASALNSGLRARVLEWNGLPDPLRNFPQAD